MKGVMKIAAVNFPAVWGDKEKNLSRILDYIEIAGREGVQMLIFPETALTGYDVEPGGMLAEERMQRRLAETIPGNATDKVCELSKKYDMYVIFGMAERDLEDSSKVYNAAAVCGPDGLIGSCRKLHLPFAEALWACPGEKPFLFDTPWGPVSVSICYDSYCFPEITRYARAKGARLHINCTAICTLESPGAGGYLGNLALQYLAMNNIFDDNCLDLSGFCKAYHLIPAGSVKRNARKAVVNEKCEIWKSVVCCVLEQNLFLERDLSRVNYTSCPMGILISS